jgi:hypothetical protein
VFGLVGFIAPLISAFWTGRLTFDVIALIFAAIGATISRRSFASFPWTALLCLVYPLVFVAGCFTPNVADYRYWLIPSRGADGPHALYLVLAIWACLNAGLIYRFHRVQQLAGREARRWQFGLRLLLGLMALVALTLGLGSWYYRLSQPPPWASADALEQRYAKQLARLADDARNYGQIWTPARRDREELQKLFGADEIVDAFVWTKSTGGGESRVGLKLDGDSVSGVCLLERNPRIGHPIVNYWSRRFVEYEALVKDKNGVERGYTLIVDSWKMK